MGKIEWLDKVKIRTLESINRISKWTQDDINETKASVNELYDHTGWARYEDSQYTEGSPLTLENGTDKLMPNNAGVTITSQLPYDGETQISLYDGTKITPAKSGDAYVLRIDFDASLDAIDGFAEFSIDIGGTEGKVIKRTVTFPKGKNVTHGFSITSFIFTLGTFVSNGGIVKIKPSTTMKIWNIAYNISRIHYGR